MCDRMWDLIIQICGAVCYAVQGGSLWFWGWSPLILRMKSVDSNLWFWGWRPLILRMKSVDSNLWFWGWSPLILRMKSVDSNLWFWGWSPLILTFDSEEEVLWFLGRKLLSCAFLWCCLSRCTKWFQLLSLWMKSLRVTIQMKATKQYFPVVLFIMLYKVILTFESVDEILKCNHSNESYWAVLSCGAVYYAVQGGSNFWVCGWNPKVWPFKWKLLSNTFLWCCLLCYTGWL